jgi:hypothetical protein
MGSKFRCITVYSNRQGIFQRKVLRVFREDRTVVPSEGKVVADEYPQSDRARQSKTLVVGVPDPNGETATLEAGRQIQHAEHFHAIRR